jgi:hypothetical protein
MSATFSRMRIADLVGRGPNLVGRGSRMTGRCFRSLRSFDTLVSIGPISPPSRWATMIHVLGRDPNLKTRCQHAARWVRLGERFRLAPDWAGLHQGPCYYQSAIREPRPTSEVATNHHSPISNHFLHPGYVCF